MATEMWEDKSNMSVSPVPQRFRSTSAPQGPYVTPQAPKLDPMIVTTKQVPYRCPICEGRGYVEAGFYTGGLAEGANPEPCRSCVKGLIWVTETTTGRV